MSYETSLRDALLVDLSRQIAMAIDAQPNHCAANAWRALITFPDLFQANGRLVEGWFVIETADRVVMNEHVWCELGGQIVDPSVLFLVSDATPVWYFSGLTRSWEETEALEGELFPHVRFEGYGKDGLGHPGYKAAREAARCKVLTQALAQQPPKAMQFLTAQDREVLAWERPEQPCPPIVEGEPLNIELSLTTATKIQALPGRCWYNARKALVQMPHRFFSGQYIEGWLVGHFADAIHVTEHGWVQTLHHGIVDPTIVLDEVPRRIAYFPGIEVSWSEIQASLTSPLPLARHQPRPGMLAYQASCRSALERGEQLAWQTGLPLVSEPGSVTIFRHTGGVLLGIEEIPWDFPVPTTPSARVQALLRKMEQEAQGR